MAVRRIWVIRHAESLEDIDDSAYERIDDDDMPLSPLGVRQAHNLALQMQYEIGSGKSLHLQLSPCKRVLDTASLLVSHLHGVECYTSTNELLTKQNWGSVTCENRKQVERARYETGVLRYSFKDGETAEEFIGRFSQFVKDLRDQFQRPDAPENIAIMTHGFEFRIFLMILLGWDEEYFESLAHPHNCEIKRLLVLDNCEVILRNKMRLHDASGGASFIRRKTTQPAP